MRAAEKRRSEEREVTHLKISDVVPDAEEAVALDGQQSAVSEKIVRVDRVSGEVQLHNKHGISMSAFLKASHRLRSMSLVGGYVIQCRGRFKAFMETSQVLADNFAKEGQGAPASRRWHQLIAECELKIRFSLRRQKYVLEIHSLDVFEVQRDKIALAQSETSASTANQPALNESQADQHQQEAQTSKFSFDLQYALCLQPQQSSQQLQLSKQINKEISNIKGSSQLAHQQSGEQLKQLIDKLKPNDTIIWKNVDNK